MVRTATKNQQPDRLIGRIKQSKEYAIKHNGSTYYVKKFVSSIKGTTYLGAVNDGKIYSFKTKQTLMDHFSSIAPQIRKLKFTLGK